MNNNILAKQDSTDLMKRNELRVSAILYSSVSSPIYGMGYKYHFNKSAIRLGVNLSTNHDNSLSNNYDRYTNQSFSSLFSLGYELHYLLEKKFQFFYGINGNFLYNKNLRKRDFNSITGTLTLRDENNNFLYRYDLNPFIGLKYYINQRVSISTESSFSISYNQKENNYTSYDYSPSYKEETISLKTNYWDINFYPLSAISINFHF